MKKNCFSRLLIMIAGLSALIMPAPSSAQTINTFAGTGSAGFGGDGGPATVATFRNPTDIIMDGSGNFYIADWNNQRVRKISSTGTVSTIAGTGGTTFGGDGGPATAATLWQPASLAFDGSGNLYISDNIHNRIRMINSSGIITTVVGTGSGGFSGDGGAATAAQINNPRGIAIDASGNLYIADESNNRVRKVTPSGIISTVAGTGTAGYNGDGIAGTAAQLFTPRDVAVDASGNLYIADNSNHRIRKINSSGIISTVAGTGSGGYSGEGGPATAAQLNYPQSVNFDPWGNMYISTSNRVRKINSSGIISLYAGDGLYSYFGDGGPATAGSFKGPMGMTWDPSGNTYICDESNHAIRSVTPAAVTVSGSSVVCVGDAITLTGSVSGGTWISATPGVATVGSSSGVVTGVSAGTVVISYTESGSTGTRTITVNPLPAAITGPSTVCIGGTSTLADADAGGTWSVSSGGAASVSGSGVVSGLSAGAATITYTLPSGCYVTASLTVDPCPFLSVGNTTVSAGIAIYPNPNAGDFTLSLPANASSITVSDYIGRIVSSPSVTAGGQHTQSVQLADLPSGNYIIQVSCSGGIYRTKLTVIR